MLSEYGLTKKISTFVHSKFCCGKPNLLEKEKGWVMLAFL